MWWKEWNVIGGLLTRNIVNFRNENISNYTEAEILAISQSFLMNEGILSEKHTEIEMQTFKKDTYNLKGDLVDSKVEEYIITFVPTNDSSNISIYSTTDFHNQEITINVSEKGILLD